MKALSLLMIAAVGFAVADFGNDPPVPGRRPVFYTGGAKSGVEIEIVYDLMCSDSAAAHPEVLQFLDMPFLNSNVKDQIQLSYTFLPLPYHHEVWVPHLLVPSILDTCHTTPQSCIFEQYMQFWFENINVIIGEKDSSEKQIIQNWTKLVSEEFSIDQAKLLGYYSRGADTSNSEMRTRYMYKYNAHHHVSGTPFAFVNGILLSTFPETADDWMNMLSSVYEQTDGGFAYAWSYSYSLILKKLLPFALNLSMTFNSLLRWL